jgi:hypothetical protein
MIALLIALALLIPTPTTAIQITVLGVDDRPISGLTLTLQDGTQAVSVLTDANGAALSLGLNGPAVFVTDAVLPDGKRVQIDPTTPRDGMRLGLIPNETRRIVLRFDPAANLLFIDPEVLFSGEVLPSPIFIESQETVEQPTVKRGLPPFVKGLLLFAALVGVAALSVWIFQIYQYRKSRSRT